MSTTRRMSGVSERLGLRLTGRLALFTASMRAGGARVGIDALLSAHRALAAVDSADRRSAYFALRPVFCSSYADLEAFDAAFDEWFGRREAAPAPRSPGRRLRPAARRGAQPPDGRLDLQRRLRASLRHDGEPLDRHWREPAERARPLVFVCDASGSIEPYARMVLQYVQACTGHRRVEALTFATELGAALATLSREHGRRLGSGAVVVLLSDGWDRGDPLELETELARLSRCAHRLIWLDPLKAYPDHEPLPRGMRAALPYVDHFSTGNSLASPEELALLIEGGFE